MQTSIDILENNLKEVEDKFLSGCLLNNIACGRWFLNIGNILGHLNGSFFTNLFGITSTNYVNLKWFILVAKVFSLLPLPILYFIDNPEK